MLTPCLVHFPDRDPRIVMSVGGGTPRVGEEFLNGWIVERQAPAAQDDDVEYDREIWVKPRA